jgi:hypothetical protein
MNTLMSRILVYKMYFCISYKVILEVNLKFCQYVSLIFIILCNKVMVSAPP